MLHRFLYWSHKNQSGRVLMISLFWVMVLLHANSLATAGSATLSWTAPTTNLDGTPLTDLAGYKVYLGTVSGVYGVPIDVGFIASSSPSYTVSNLGTGTYYFAVTAYDSTGLESSLSNEASKTFSASGLTITAIASGSITSSSGVITWSTNISASSQIEYGTSNAYGSLSNLDSNIVTGHSQNITGLQAGTTYHFRVKSVDGTGNIVTSEDNVFTTSTTGLSGNPALATPAAGGCGMIKPENRKSSGPGQAADMLAIIALMVLASIRKLIRPVPSGQLE
jgi:hypothetical protein